MKVCINKLVGFISEAQIKAISKITKNKSLD